MEGTQHRYREAVDGWGAGAGRVGEGVSWAGWAGHGWPTRGGRSGGPLGEGGTTVLNSEHFSTQRCVTGMLRTRVVVLVLPLTHTWPT